MGIFDKFFNVKTETAPTNYAPLNEQDAWVGVLYACGAIVGTFNDAEVEHFARMVTFKSLFTGHDIIVYYKKAMIFKNSFGSKRLIDDCVPQLSEQGKPTLFCLAVELLLSDGRLDEDEKGIIEYLQASMNVDNDVAARIVEVMLIRNKWNKVFAE